MGDSNVESVIDRLHERADVGLAKYGVTTERDDLDFENWLQHLQDELLDGAVYIARLRTETVPQSLQDAEHWKTCAEAAEARCARLADMLQLILPMAKGYAAEHPVGSNAKYVAAAEAALSDTAQEQPDTDYDPGRDI